MNPRSRLSRILFARALGQAVQDELNAQDSSAVEEWLHWQAFAEYKYDDYEQFVAGRRFTESQILWLTNLPEKTRLHVHNLIRDKLIYISSSEMHHFVRMAHHDLIMPSLLRQVAQSEGMQDWELPKVRKRASFIQQARASLYLGMSDGAHLATFRRYAGLKNDQAATTFELDASRLKALSVKLQEDLVALGATPGPKKFTRVVLLDDFTASGKTYLRQDPTTKAWGGKIASFAEKLAAEPHTCANQTAPAPVWADLVERDGLIVHIVFYVATSGALGRIRQDIAKMKADLLKAHSSVEFIVDAVQEIPESSRLDRSDTVLAEAIDACYDSKACESSSTKVGGTDDVRYGFADGRLPVVLYHNTPNNSIPLLWAPDYARAPGLFPRIARHRDGV